MITLEDSFYKRREDDGTVVICVLLKSDIKRNVTFNLVVNSLTAEGQWRKAVSCMKQREW